MVKAPVPGEAVKPKTEDNVPLSPGKSAVADADTGDPPEPTTIE
jgi:hypothetical protein